jgi:carboxymethylenebutenolidase
MPLDLTDPISATSLTLGRRSFVGLSATATTAAILGGSIATALAQGTGFGQPHPPIVAEDDPSISIARPRIPAGARSLDAYFAAPKGAGPATPAVVVVQAIWGVDAQLRDVVRRFAKEGYLAIAPDLYSGLGAPSGDGATDVERFRAFAAQLADDRVDADLAATAAFLRAVPRPDGVAAAPARTTGKIGVTGFCMGGGITLRQAVDNAKTFGAAMVFYGKVRYGTTDNKGEITPIALDYASDIGIPLAGSWGERDTSIAAADVRVLDAKLTALGKPHDLRVYDLAGHAFFDDTRPSYVPAAAADSWTRMLGWFARNLA